MHEIIRNIRPKESLLQAQSSVEPYGNDPLVIAEAKGAYVTDTCGRRYLDAVSGYWLACLGYGDDELCDLMSKAARQLSYWHHCGTVHKPALEYISELSSHLDKSLRGKFLFAATGSGAMENGLRVACARDDKLGRPSVFGHLDRGYHGSTFLTQQLSPDRWNDWPASIRLMKEQTIAFPTPQSHDEVSETLGQLEDSLRKGKGPTIFVTEPILGVGGVLEPPHEFFTELRQLLSSHGVTWISDEISTGFGATGALFAYENSGAIPDILVLGKKMSAGYYPLTAAIVSTSLSEEVFTDVFHYGYSFSGHPVGCEVALAVLRRIATTKMLDSIKSKGELLRTLLTQSVGGMLGEDCVRGRGLMTSVDLGSGQAARKACLRLRELGIYEITEGRYLVYCPPYIVTESEIERLADATAQAVRLSK